VNVLVVEDAKDIALLLEIVLRGEGHNVECWTSAFSSIAELAPWDQIDVVMCDQDLDGYDGKELFRWISTEHPEVRRVMITGSSMTDEASAYADLVLIKPRQHESGAGKSGALVSDEASKLPNRRQSDAAMERRVDQVDAKIDRVGDRVETVGRELHSALEMLIKQQDERWRW
jgi:CheY-like chemotaxis protein